VDLMPSTSKSLRELNRLAAGLTDDFTIEKTKRGHYKVTVFGPAGQKSIFASCTPSDYRESRNLTADLARAVQALGGRTTRQAINA
jgi:hypothetical protein